MHRHHHHRMHGPHTSWLKYALGIFLFLTLIKFGGWWLFFAIPFLFYWMGPRHHDWNESSWGWGCDTDEESVTKQKNDEKPKRQVVETADGEWLEVIDEPRQV
jgi:hypothetical protein